MWSQSNPSASLSLHSFFCLLGLNLSKQANKLQKHKGREKRVCFHSLQEKNYYAPRIFVLGNLYRFPYPRTSGEEVNEKQSRVQFCSILIGRLCSDKGKIGGMASQRTIANQHEGGQEKKELARP